MNASCIRNVSPDLFLVTLTYGGDGGHGKEGGAGVVPLGSGGLGVRHEDPGVVSLDNGRHKLSNLVRSHTTAYS